jgi:UDP-glucose 4-epimerase
MLDEGILVTGGAGFIGSNLVDLLLGKGHTVYVLDDLSTGRMENLEDASAHEGLRFIRGDVRDPLDNYLTPRSMGEGPRVDAIIHLAARVDVTSSFRAPLDDARTNYIGTLNVLDHALKNGIEKVVMASSAAVYGDTTVLPVNEDARARPLSPYGLHKLASEHLMDIYSDQYGMSNTCLRFFNVYGPRQDPTSPYSGVISKFFDRALLGQPLLVYGDGEQTRDFIYVGDVAEALYAAYVKSPGGVMNIATGKETSVNDLAKAVISASGSSSSVIHSPSRKGEILRSSADTRKAEKDIGFTANIDLKTGLMATLRHMKGRR